ncbi:hypothetical protein [Rhodococcus sp. HNM0569]|uniref:LppU family putative lipoprotein n=1 Tax=Rhodococcus sp. HNM0569 TaxID=2716340 RepID=UPI00146C2089|nr:hypothetical protein [Rhodococcus sp. HNM0569]NLU83745.1 hypothetical protein [Rhodococcus sp. HNM0569]
MTTVPVRIGRAAAAVCAAAAVLALSGCGQTITPRAVAADDRGPTTGADVPFSEYQLGDDTGDVDADVTVGECVHLGGAAEAAEIRSAPCGAADANYRVVATAPSKTQCSPDADSYYYEMYFDVEQGAVCLDIDWVPGGCMDLGGDEPRRIDCADRSAVDRVEVTDILSGTTSAEDCPRPADGGFEYVDRRFVVCIVDAE